MDNPLVSSLFRALFRHRPCRLPRTPSLRRPLPVLPRRPQHRTFLNYRDDLKIKSSGGEWHAKSPYIHVDMTEEFKRYPLVTAEELSTHRERPKRVKMLVRDYVDGIPPPPCPAAAAPG